MILKDIINKFDKSNIKAGDGLEKGNYPLYTCSPVVNKFLNDYLYDDEAIIISTGGNFAAHYVKGSFNYSTDCYVFNTDKYNLKYLYYYLLSKSDDVNKMFRGAGLKHLNKNEFVMLNIKEIPLNEQDRIVNQLDKINEMIEVRKKEIDKFNNLIKSQFVEMFGDPVDNTLDWDVSQIGDICFVTKLAGFEYSKYINYKDSGDVIMIRGLNVKNNKLKLDDVYYIDKDVSDSLPRSQLHSGDICMTYVGINIGDVAIVDDKNLYHLAPNVAKISLNDKNKTNPLFFVNLLAYNKRNFASTATNTAKQALNMERIRNLKVMMPPIELQNKFAQIVEQIDKQKFEFENSLKKLEELQASLMQEYFG